MFMSRTQLPTGLGLNPEIDFGTYDLIDPYCPQAPVPPAPVDQTYSQYDDLVARQQQTAWSQHPDHVQDTYLKLQHALSDYWL